MASDAEYIRNPVGVDHGRCDIVDYRCSKLQTRVVLYIMRSERNQERETTKTRNLLHPRKIGNSQNSQHRAVDNQRTRELYAEIFLKTVVSKESVLFLSDSGTGSEESTMRA